MQNRRKYYWQISVAHEIQIPYTKVYLTKSQKCESYSRNTIICYFYDSS